MEPKNGTWPSQEHDRSIPPNSGDLPVVSEAKDTSLVLLRHRRKRELGLLPGPFAMDVYQFFARCISM